MKRKNVVVWVVVSFAFILLSACGADVDVSMSSTETEAQEDGSRATSPEPISAPLTERPGHIRMSDPNTVADYALRSFLQGPAGVTWGPDGVLYVADATGHHIVRVSENGSMTDLGLWQTVESLQQDGPNGVAFDSEGNLYILIHSRIVRVGHDGDVESVSGLEPVAGFDVHIGGIAVSPEDELYYTDMDYGKVYRWNPGGSPITVAAGVPQAENMVFGLDGTLYLTRQGEGEVLTVDIESGAVEVFAADVCGPDPCYLAVDHEGDIWVQGLNRLYQYSSEGVEKRFVVDGESYPGGPYNWQTSAGIAVDDEGGLWVASYTSRLVRLAPVTPGETDPDFTMQIIAPGFEASDLAVDSRGAVYATDSNGRQIVVIHPDGEAEVLLQHGSSGRMAVAVDENNAVYVGMPHGEIVRLEEDGSLTHYADLLTRRMVFGADGVLYAVVGEAFEPKSIVAITGIDTYSVLATNIDGISLGAGEAHISPALDQGLYVYTEWECHLFFVDFDGQGRLIANLQDLGAGGGASVMAASPISGDVFLVPHGPYALFRIDAEGHHEEIAARIFGDPWGMAVSRDGAFLYIAESGAVDRIRISGDGS